MTELRISSELASTFPAPAAIAHPAVGAEELDAGIARLAGHHDAIGVRVGDVVVLDGIVEPAFPECARALDLNRPGSLGVVAPLRRVEQVRAPVADDAARNSSRSSGS